MSISKRSDLYYASDKDVEDFFRSIVFRGQYSEFPSKNDDNKRFCGKIEHITMNGMTNDFCPSCIYVPAKFSSYVKTGLCEFHAQPLNNELRGEHHKYKLIITRIESVKHTNVKRDNQAESRFRRNLRLVDDKFIGLFTENKDGSFAIRDIRRSDFSKLLLQNGKEQAPIVYHPHLFKPKDGVYYEFSWILNDERDNYVYLFKVDETRSFQEITPNNVVQRLHDCIMNYSADASQKIVKMLDTLKNQLTANGKEIFIYELLQNANDYPVRIDNVAQKVDVEFHLTLSSLIFMHSGAVFNEKNIAAICSINDKEKDTNKDAIGYKGIGFKTVFLDNENVYLQTGGFSLRFDRQATKDIVDTPWQILPIWTKYQDLTQAERAIFTHADDNFRVKFALKPTKIETLRESAHNYERMFHEIFKDERAILFIPNLSTVKVYLKGTPVPDIVCSRNNNAWRVDDFVGEIDESITEAINSEIDEQESTGGLKIPTKYYNFKKTKVSFACEVEGRKLKKVNDTCLYCYLPAKDATWGLDFLMNTDMIPNGARDDIEVDFQNSTNVNETIANIAGSKLFEWIDSLTRCGEFELDSVYSLIPNFESLKSGRLKYKALINSFEKGFVDKVGTEAFVPTQEGYACLHDIIIDKTGITSCDIISDEDFIRYTDNTQKYLPNIELRRSSSFSSFAELYLRMFDVEENIFDLDGLRELIGRNGFQEWLKVQENNNKFLNFLLEKGWLEDFLDEKIFIEDECGDLYSACNLYYDVDEHLVDLQAFSQHICYLSRNTRDYFRDNEEWNNVTHNKFADFDPEHFVLNTLLSFSNREETVEKLKDAATSLHFYKFVAINEIVNDEIDSLPFLNASSEVECSFKDRNFVFFASTEGARVSKSQWLDKISIAFVSKDYDKCVLEYFEEHLSVKQYTHEVVVNEMILGENFFESIQCAINDDYSISEDFVQFCFDHKDLFDKGSLENYALSAIDCNGDVAFIVPKDDELYLPSSLYDTYSGFDWLGGDWMYCLDKDYIMNCSNGQIEAFRDFMALAFGVKDITDKTFYKRVVRKHLVEINECITNSQEENLSFIAYLDEHYQLIFGEENDAEKYKGFSLLSDDSAMIYGCNRAVYTYNQELEEILGKEWMPNGIACMCTRDYGTSQAIRAIGVKDFVFAEFFKKVIVPCIQQINEAVTTLEASVDFHELVIEHQGEIPADDLKQMKRAKVYLLDRPEPVYVATGNAILSKTAKELAQNGLVAFSQLRIVDPAYNAEDKARVSYWSTTLENSKFTPADFIDWLKKNSQTFVTTITDQTKNIVFWRWAKKNLSENALKSLLDLSAQLPIWLADDTCIGLRETIYLSDSYMPIGMGVEGYVKRFDNAARFISSLYCKDDADVTGWHDFWTLIGVKSEIKDILISTIIPNLKDIDEADLLTQIIKYRNDLEQEFNDLPAALKDIRVKAKDGRFYNLKETVYVNCTDQSEPFPYIEIPNQITFDSGEERQLIKEIMSRLNVGYVDSLTDWRKAKMQSYLLLQGDSNRCAQFNSIHFAFIDELASLREEFSDFKTQLGDELDKVLILNQDEEYVLPTTLTASSVYHPFCDFQSHGISLAYTSDVYNDSTKCKNKVSKVLRALGVHCDFKKEDIPHLVNREFACYFWTTYLENKANHESLDRIIGFMKSDEFHETACIPTKDCMKRPADLYSPSINKYVKETEDWENKLPLEAIFRNKYNGQSLIDFLPFKEALSFPDCLYALLKMHSKEDRKKIVSWAIEGYQDQYALKVDEYREDSMALWVNTQSKRVQIKSLYALEKGNATLGQFFNELDCIINPDYIKESDFDNVCKLFKIQIIQSEDLVEYPESPTNMTQQLKQRLCLSALVLAGSFDLNTWEETYARYAKCIDQMRLWRCDSISLQYKYNAMISQSLKKFYFKKDTKEFFYVNDIDSKHVFKDFVEAFIDYLEVPQGLNSDLVNAIMDNEEMALGQITTAMKGNDEFMNQLDEIIPGMKDKMVVSDTANVDDDCFDGSVTPTYTAQVNSTEADDAENEEDEDVSNMSSIESSSNSNSQGESILPSELHSNDNGNKRSEDIRQSVSVRMEIPRRMLDVENRSSESHGQAPVLRVREASQIEVDEINNLLDGSLSAEEAANQNYLVRLRLYNSLVERGLILSKSKADFVRNGRLYVDNKYVHGCSARYGILYISPKIWNRLAEGSCVVCVYYGKQADEFIYLESIEDVLQRVSDDDIVIKLSGTEKAKAVNALYSSILKGVTGTAYTMIRLASNEKYDSIFKLINNDPNQNNDLDDNDW